MIYRAIESGPWWIAAIAALALVLQTPSCIDKSELRRNELVATMTAHCQAMHKTYKAESTQHSNGMCI